MAIKQVSVNQEDIPWNLLPNNWSQLVKKDWQEKTDGLNGVADVANEANQTAGAEANRNDEQDAQISQNKSKISEVESNVSVLSQSVNQNASSLSDHTSSNSQHGVNGNNVGTEDYAQAAVGGVVLIADNIAEIQAIQVSIANAPADYDQAYMQTIATAVNSLASKQGDIINLLNGILRGQKSAKQMQPDA